jgi:hypothetical protein
MAGIRIEVSLEKVDYKKKEPWDYWGIGIFSIWESRGIHIIWYRQQVEKGFHQFL